MNIINIQVIGTETFDGDALLKGTVSRVPAVGERVDWDDTNSGTHFSWEVSGVTHHMDAEHGAAVATIQVLEVS